MKLDQIKQKTLRHISSLTRYLDMSDKDRLKSYDFVVSTIWDYHRIYESYTEIRLADVSHFFDIWYDDYYGDVAEDDKCICGLPLVANGRNCYEHMTRGY